MKVVKCDCCGKELVGRIFKFAFEIEDEFGNIISGQEDDKEWQELQGNVDDKDYCFECAKSISKMTFSQTCEESTEHKEEIPNLKLPKKNDIDLGKACALKTAGWTNKDIAYEVHCSVNTINQKIKAKMKEYQEERS